MVPEPRIPPVMAEEDGEDVQQRNNAPATATQDHATPEMPETRRTSTSSMGRETPSMQASQTSESVRRQRPRPLDYGRPAGVNGKRSAC